ncbi:MAG: DoxX family protein [Lentimonas sp.]
METAELILKFIIPLGIFNVWLVRYNKPTPYRGGSATNLKEEFSAYGLSELTFYVIGVFKLTAALLILLSVFFTPFLAPGAFIMSALMLGAVLMHAKVGDPLIRYLPASAMLFMSLLLLV